MHMCILNKRKAIDTFFYFITNHVIYELLHSPGKTNTQHLLCYWLLLLAAGYWLLPFWKFGMGQIYSRSDSRHRFSITAFKLV